MSQLHSDCLNEIFEYLEGDRITLHSCLLVNRLWCKASVRILWRNYYPKYNSKMYNTLFAYLPNESKNVLLNNGIIIPTKPPLFNYAAFCKSLSIYHIDYNIERLLRSQQSFSLQNLNNTQNLDNVILFAKQEVYKLFMNQTSLKKLSCIFDTKVMFTSFPGANNCLKDLTTLSCSAIICSEIFYQLSQICHTIQSLNLIFNDVISNSNELNGLTDLISVQKNLKYLKIIQFLHYYIPRDIIIPSLTKLSNTLTIIKLNFDRNSDYFSLSFISNFINLQELVLSSRDGSCFKDIDSVTLPQLQILTIQFTKFRHFNGSFKFLENNGKNLKEFYISNMSEDSDNLLNLAIAEFCPNLRKLYTGFKNNELETFIIVFNSCQYLESIRIWCGGEYCLSEKNALETVMKYSHEKLCEIILEHQDYVRSELLPKELESFLASWKNSMPQKPQISLIISNNKINSLNANNENMKIIKKYIELGVIKKFKVI